MNVKPGDVVDFFTRNAGERAVRHRGDVRDVSGDGLYARVRYNDGIVRPIETSRLQVVVAQPALPTLEPPAFTYGEHVVLLSGGPIMTVLSRQGDEYVCEWDAEGGYKTETFPRDRLDHYERLANVCAFRCVECRMTFSAGDVALENPLEWGHPCLGSLLIAADPASTIPPRRSVGTTLHCESYRERVPIVR